MAVTDDGVRVGVVSDAELIARARLEPAAFAPIFDRHYATIHSYLRRRLDAPIAEELAAETFARALRGVARYDEERADALPWLFGIAANLARRHRRTEVRRLAAALAELRVHDREALLLFAWAELSYEEISLALSIPVGTVRSRLHRARRTLRAHLESEETI
jgi:DNA-directed RNA polymerase specialized sigma24 family protein